MKLLLKILFLLMATDSYGQIVSNESKKPECSCYAYGFTGDNVSYYKKHNLEFPNDCTSLYFTFHKLPNRVDFTKFKNLKSLFVNGEECEKDVIRVQQMLDELKQIDKLESVDIAANYDFSGFTNIKIMKLHFLPYSRCMAYSMTSSLKSLPKLENLTLNITSLEIIPDEIFQITHLKQLEITGIKYNWGLVSKDWTVFKDLWGITFKFTSMQKWPDNFELKLHNSVRRIEIQSEYDLYVPQLGMLLPELSFHLHAQNKVYDLKNILNIQIILRECRVSGKEVIDIPWNFLESTLNGAFVFKISTNQARNVDILQAIKLEKILRERENWINPKRRSKREYRVPSNFAMWCLEKKLSNNRKAKNNYRKYQTVIKLN